MELSNEFEVDRPIDEAWVLLTDVERIAPCLPGAQLEEIEGDEYRGSVKVKVGPITANYKGKATFVEKDENAHRAVLKAEGRDARQGNANATITAVLVQVGNGTKVSVKTDLAVTGKVAQFGRGVMAEVSEKLLNQFVQNLETKVLSQAAPGAATGSPGAAAADNPAPASPAPGRSAPPSPGAAAPAATGSSAPPSAVPASSAAPSTPSSAAPSTTSSVPGAGSAAGGSTPANNGAPSTPTVRKINPSEPVEPVNLLGATGAPLAKRVAPVVGALVVLLIVSRWLRRRRG